MTHAKNFVLELLKHYKDKQDEAKNSRDFHAKTFYSGAITALEEILNKYFGMVDIEIKLYLDSLREVP